ncbi:MAG: hypothetical protein C0392_10230 [Syntrophus sp. (in: bacteria)]|nr:hypothetical protein [Syntrophus sp. (in: bacteria)]
MMDKEAETNIMADHLKTGECSAETIQKQMPVIVSDLSALYEIIRSNPDIKARKDAATHLLGLVDTYEDIDVDMITEVYRSEREIAVATVLKRVLNKLQIKQILTHDPTEGYDPRLSPEEELKINEEIKRLKRLYDTSKKEEGSFDRKYSIVQHIDQGGMAKIYKGIKLDDNQPVAIKFLLLEELSHHINPERLIARFRREGELLTKRLKHPNIIKAFEYGEADKEYYIVLEYVEGETLEGMIKQKPLDLDNFKKVALQILDAVEYIHGNDVIHRDIKPGNILVERSAVSGQTLEEARWCTIKLADFGLAKDKYDKKLSKLFFQGGTDLYSSPQQLRDTRDVDERDDIFSVGKTLYEMLTGKTFTNDESYMPMVLENDLLSQEVNTVIRKCLSHERQDRYRNIHELRSALLGALRAA